MHALHVHFQVVLAWPLFKQQERLLADDAAMHVVCITALYLQQFNHLLKLS